MDERTDMERNIAKRTGRKGRGKRWREKQRELNTDSCFFGGVKKRVSLVITQTDREGDEGREAAE